MLSDMRDGDATSWMIGSQAAAGSRYKEEGSGKRCVLLPKALKAPFKTTQD